VRASRVLRRSIGSCALVVCAASANAQNDRAYVAAFDRYMTPATGTIDLLSIDHALSAVEDRWLPPARFDEPGWFKRALGIGYRFGKWYGLDQPQDHFVMVVAHEVFGHGSRLREIGADGIRYSFDAPTPYGGGGAVTEFGGEVPVTRADLLAIDTGGIEQRHRERRRQARAVERACSRRHLAAAGPRLAGGRTGESHGRHGRGDRARPRRQRRIRAARRLVRRGRVQIGRIRTR
jgi:hypothetical protein